CDLCGCQRTAVVCTAFYVPPVAWTRPMACEATAAGVRGRGRYCTGWLLDAALATRGSLLMRQWSAACGRPACDCRLMRLSPTRDQPSARPGPSVVWLPLLHVRTLGAAAGRWICQNATRLLHLFHDAQQPSRSFANK
ncbi:hypothetical protein BHE74_00024495, partial [Ensete ventricosum]